MTISQLRLHTKKQLKGLYAEEEIQSFVVLLAEAYLDMSRLEITLNVQQEIPPQQFSQFEDAIGRLRNFEPIQYIIGHTEFFDLQFKVNSNVLIPRPETEGLVRWIIDDLRVEKASDNLLSLEIIDLCTGSGCIAITLKHLIRNANVSAIDISAEALQVAKDNAQINEAKVNFIKDDVLKLQALPKSYNIIISNPPYVRELEKKEMSDNVLKHEPELALFVADDNALIFYRKIAELSKKHLKPNGKVYLEINEYLGLETETLFKDLGFKTTLKKDIFGRDRMLKAYF